MAPSGLRRSGEVIRERIGPDATYPSFVRPSVINAERPPTTPPVSGFRVLRLLWLASLALFVVVVILAVLVALGV
jgi:hypothetical protein